MSIGDHKARPSALQGGNPLVASRSAPTLISSSSTLTGAGLGRLERPAPDPATPTASPRNVLQLHPMVSPEDDSPATPRADSREDAKREATPDSPVLSSPRGPAPVASGPLVRFVGGFSVTPDPRLEEDNDVLTAVAESIQRSGQQQPDSALPSSGEGTPQVQPGTPARSDSPDSPNRLPRSRMPGREKTD